MTKRRAALLAFALISGVVLIAFTAAPAAVVGMGTFPVRAFAKV